MPDEISAAVINGETYLLTVKEGDSRAWQAGSETDTNEIKDKTSPQTGDGSGLHLYIALLLISGGTPVGIAAVGRAGICAFAGTGRDLSGDNCMSNRCAAQKAAYFSAFVML